MNEVLIAISGGEGGLRALERPTMLLNHPVVRVGCWRGSAPRHDPCGAAHTRTSCWGADPLQKPPEHEGAACWSFPLGSVGCGLEEPILAAGMGGLPRGWVPGRAVPCRAQQGRAPGDKPITHPGGV